MKQNHSRILHVGCDTGTVSVKAALATDNQRLAEEISAEGFFSELSTEALAGRGVRAFLSPYRRLLGNPFETLRTLLDEIERHAPSDVEFRVTLTGSGGRLAAKRLGLQHLSEFKTLAAGVSGAYPDVRAVLEMGGENSKFLRVEAHEEGGFGIVDYGSNGDCAAGTGSFLDQQATRLLFNVEEIGDIAMSVARGAKIAGRCSVFAKSDMIHAQQKGASPAQVLRGLCEAVARNFKSNVAKGLELDGRAAFVGGVAQNAGVAAAMRAAFEADEENLFVPEAPAFYSALGAALLSLPETMRAAVPHRRFAAEEQFPAWPRLTTSNVRFLAEELQSPVSYKKVAGDVYLGVDVGSVSTNLVLIDDDGNVLDEIYIRTKARPIEAVGEGLTMLRERHGNGSSPGIRVRGVGSTGSGRELIGELIGADSIHDEITAHKTGAFHLAERMMDCQVDTIFEIGGQDAKFIRLKDGVVIDFTMNEACAAGTGSFLEEQAEKLGVNIVDEFASLALASQGPLRLGERCTVYMEQDLSHRFREGAAKEDIIAGLSYSVVQNYLNRVARGRPVGDTIFFQGGTAYNRAVAAAFSEVLGKTIIVPPHNGVIGAYGAALIARERMNALGGDSKFRGFDIKAVGYSVKEFTCEACSNRCDIQQFTVEGRKSYWGDKCSERYRKEAKIERQPVLPDLIKLRAEALEADWFATMRNGEAGAELSRLAEKAERQTQGRASRPKIAMLRAMYFFDRFPFWNTYLRALGIDPVVTETTTKRIADAGVECAVAEPCFPVQVSHGHLRSLKESDADAILLPSQINSETDDPSTASHACPWGQTLPFVLGHSPAAEGLESRLLRPIVHFREGEAFIEKELWPLFRRYAADRSHHKNAVALGYAAQRLFQERIHKLGAEALAELDRKDAMAIVLVGRPYNLCDPGLNLNLPAKLRALYGIDVIPMDFLPSEGVRVGEFQPNMYWNYGRRILRAAKWTATQPRLHLIYLTNFKCGPDSYLKNFAADAAEKPFLTLQFDAHGNDAGMMTRCEAYLDSKGFMRWWNTPKAQVSKAEPCTSRACAPERHKYSPEPSAP